MTTKLKEIAQDIILTFGNTQLSGVLCFEDMVLMTNMLEGERKQIVTTKLANASMIAEQNMHIYLILAEKKTDEVEYDVRAVPYEIIDGEYVIMDLTHGDMLTTLFKFTLPIARVEEADKLLTL